MSISECLGAILNTSLKEKGAQCSALSLGLPETFTQSFCWSVGAVSRHTKLPSPGPWGSTQVKL